MYYDYILTFEREVVYVWGRKFHVLTVVYYFCRYSILANVIFTVGLVNKMQHIRVSWLLQHRV